MLLTWLESVQCGLRIFLKHELMKVCILCVVVFVVLQVSDPYNRTDLTFELNSRILVEVEIWFDFQMFFIMVKAALAFPIRDFTSASVPPP